MFRCPSCGYKNDFDSENCSFCGIAFYVDGEDVSSPTEWRELLMFPCPRCRQLNELGSGNCASCGARLGTNRESKRKQEEWSRAPRWKKLGWYLRALMKAMAKTDWGPG